MSTTTIGYPRILGVGNVFLDYPIHVDDSYLTERNIQKGAGKLVEHLDVENDQKGLLGGSCPNVIKVLALMGNRCTLFGKVGNDAAGDEACRRLEECGVKLLLPQAEGKSGRSICYITPDKDRTMVASMGVTKELHGNELQDEFFKNITHTHIEGYNVYCEGVLEKSVRLAEEACSTISLDLSGTHVVEAFKDRFVEVAEKVHVLFGNAMEMKALTGLESPKEAAESFGVAKTIVVTEGAKGCWIKAGGSIEAQNFEARKVTHVVDTTGAGDYFAAGFLHGWLHRYTPEKCVKLGSTAASQVIQSLGADVEPDFSDWDK